MGFMRMRHLWQVFTCAAPAVPAAYASIARKTQKPPNKWYVLREEIELALLVPWLPEAERWQAFPLDGGRCAGRAARTMPAVGAAGPQGAGNDVG